MTPPKNDPGLFSTAHAAKPQGPVTCLGMTFENDEARREHFLDLLRQGLEELHAKLGGVPFTTVEDALGRMKSVQNWPMGDDAYLRELTQRMSHADSNKDLLQRWKDEVGFPHGRIEDILNLSDPPYYTACPNPFLSAMVQHWQEERKKIRIRNWLANRDVGQAFQPAIQYPDLREFTKQDLDAVRQYQRRLPHWELEGSTYFITFRVNKSVGEPFRDAKLASLLEESLWYSHGERYYLDAYAIMPDHVHLLLKPLPGYSLSKILQGIKGYTARELNKLLKRKGSFWQDENFDHIIRNEADWLDKLDYIHNNPVKWGLVKRPQDYPFSSLVTIHSKGRLESLPHTDNYRREPFAADVSEGKNDPIYNAHSYHTKVPHKAIMRYILHYTEPGDVVFDGFCGTGMTGVAAQLCGDRKAVESLGYQVDDQGVIYQQEEETDESGKKRTVWKPFSRLGARRAVLNDLSPAATFIAYNYNAPVDVQAFEREAKRILGEVEEECGWMYATLASSDESEAKTWADKLRACKTADEIRELLGSWSSALGTGPTWGRINYTVWSDVFVCPECMQEVVFWEAAVDKEAGKVHKEFPCPHCGVSLTKRSMDRAWVTRFDKAIGQTIRQAKQVPVLINYSVGKKRHEKTPDAFDLALIEKIEELDIPYWFPTDPIPEGDKTGEPLRIGITHVHHLYTKRNLWVLGAIAAHSAMTKRPAGVVFLLTGALPEIIRLARLRIGAYFHGGRGPVSAGVSGTLYLPSIAAEKRAMFGLANRLQTVLQMLWQIFPDSKCILSTQSSGGLTIHEGFADYIFTDPPFGGNLMYSELNFLWESWLKVFTNNKPEAITNKVQGKRLPEYQCLMTACFKECYRVLKPGRWMTVEFHNSKNSIWNSIQEALQVAGFIIADVRTLDKKQGSFNAINAAGAVKQDLVISAYKPNGGLEERFKLTAGSEEGVWDFVRTHLKQLPVFVSKDGKAEIIAERQNYLLFDRMVAFHVQRGVTVPLSAAEFYAGLHQRFVERNGMYFLPEQVAEYDKKRMKVKEVLQLELFVTDESSAIQWLRVQLTRKPQTFQELHPQFLKEIGGWQRHEKPLELSELLEENFLRYEGKGPIPAQIVSWMKQSSALRKTIQEELASGRASEENGQLSTQSSVLITRAKDRWYVPDPNKACDLEKLRERALLREFEEYRQCRQKRLRVFRLEAVRAGFKKAWAERDYATIIAVARKIPENVLQEDPKLLMWYDQAVTRTGEDE